MKFNIVLFNKKENIPKYLNTYYLGYLLKNGKVIR
jgi:hypothetical protein